MTAEWTQERGREGVAMIKRWLEATTYIELPFDAYHHPRQTTVLYEGGRKGLDLAGHYLTGSKSPTYVECKRYSSPGHQYVEYKKLLAIAYAAALKEQADFGAPSEAHYVWVTTHPFILNGWVDLETRDELVQGLSENPTLMGAGPLDEDVARAVAARTMVLLFNEKQEAISLSKPELLKVRTVIDRKAKSL